MDKVFVGIGGGVFKLNIYKEDFLIKVSYLNKQNYSNPDITDKMRPKLVTKMEPLKGKPRSWSDFDARSLGFLGF